MDIDSNKRKIKILFIHPSLEVGGAEDLRFIVLRCLSKKNNYDLKVCCIEKIGKIGEQIKEFGIEVICLNRTSKPYNIFTTLSLFIYLLKNRFDIVQTSLFNANFHGRIAAFLARVPVIISEEHSEHYQYNSLRFLPHIYSDRILARFTDRIICCSRNLMNSISKLENIPLHKLFLLVNTFDMEKLKITRQPLDLRRELGLSENDLVIGNIASLCKRKNQGVLIKVLRLISEKLPNARLLFVGEEDPEIKQELLSLVYSLNLSGKILFLGRKDNIADYLNIMDIFVLPSLFEGIPLAMLEAMYMQVPVVASEVGGVSEIIINNKNGILVKPNNIEALAGAITGLIINKEKRIRLAQEGRKTTLERFTIEGYITELENLYNQLYKIEITKAISAFDVIYDRAIKKVPHLQPWEGHYLVRKTETEILAHRFNFNKSSIGLDVGCGNAFQSVLLASVSKKMFATDLFKENGATHSLGISKAQDLINRLNINNVTLISCSALSLPFTDNYFDFVFSSSVLEHIKNRGPVLGELKRVLRPDGYLITIVPTHMASIYAFPHAFLYLLAKISKLNSHNTSYKNTLDSGAIHSLIKRFNKNHPSFPLPEPHGDYPNIFSELSQQFPSKWNKLINKSGFKVIKNFSTCLMPWLLIEPFSCKLAAKIYNNSRRLHLGAMGKLSSLGYITCFIATNNK